jgi:hypothetical protein
MKMTRGIVIAPQTNQVSTPGSFHGSRDTQKKNLIYEVHLIYEAGNVIPQAGNLTERKVPEFHTDV